MKFRNEVYSDLVSDLIFDAFYVERPNRGKIASIRQYAEVVVRKILDLHEDDKVTLGDKGVVDKLKQVSDNNQLLMTSVNAIRDIGNRCIHTQETGQITEEDVLDCIDCLFKMYASIFVLYFKKYKFGNNDKVISAFSILPPIIRYLTLNELHEQCSENLFIIDKLSLVLLKAFGKEHAVSWLEARKEKLVQMVPYTKEYSEQIKRRYGDILGQQVLDRAPENMYVLCTDRIIEVEKVIKKNGLLYNSFEQAKLLYLEKGILAGSSDEIREFNSIMKFIYLGRKKEENSNLENIDAYTVLK